MGILDDQLSPEASLGETIEGLLQSLVETGRSVCLSIATNSMWPILRPGDRVLVVAVRAEDLRLGDIVVVRAANIRLIHRLIGRTSENGELMLITKGDNCVEGDHPWPADRLLGVVVAVERQGSRLDLRSTRARSVGAIVAQLSHGQWLAHRRLRGVAQKAVCRGLGMLTARLVVIIAHM